MPDRAPALAVVTGASSGIGLELARCAARDGHPLLIVANEPQIEDAARALRAEGAVVESALIDLSTEAGVEALLARIGERPLGAVVANAGTGEGHAFVEQDWARVRAIVGLNVLGTTMLLHRVLPRLIERGEGRILVTGSIAGFMPGPYMAVYNASKAYLDSLCYALREELEDQEADVTITCLMPGATETPFFDRADMRDTPVGQAKKADPAPVAEAGWEAMKAGKAGLTPGLVNKLMATVAGVLPGTVMARLHRAVSEPPDTEPTPLGERPRT